MAKSVIEESNIETEIVSKEASVINATEGVPLDQNCYDKKFDTQSGYALYGALFKIDSDCWGKYITIYCNNVYGEAGWLCFGSSKENFSDKYTIYLNSLPGEVDTRLLHARSVLIPDGTYWGGLSGAVSNDGLYVYEGWCSESDLSGNEYSNENLPN